MITIFEGPDGAGKTTLASWYAENRVDVDAGVAYVEHHGPYDGEANVAPNYAASLVRATHNHVVCDRAWLSEPIYGRVYRGGANRVGPAYRRMLERLAWTRQAVVVVALPPFRLVRERWRATDRMEYLDDVGQLRRVWNAYAKLDVDLPIVRATEADLDPGKLAERIVEVRPFRPLGPGGGAWLPGEVTLIVGDRPGTPTSDVPDYGVPFVSFSRVGCSYFLAEALEAAGIPESTLYWVNAYERSGKRTDPGFVDLLQPKRVVALGFHAAAWCERAGIAYDQVHHPQHWKRFHYRRRYPLVDLLKETRT